MQAPRAMPFYEYVSLAETPCPACRSGITVLQKLADAPLETCPECGQTLRRIISPPNVVSGQAHRLKESNIEKAGFTQYRKVQKGVYEKTTGKGPERIRGDD